MEKTERTVVKTYVPRYQKELWEREAADLGMSQSEFVRTMVQAGRNEMGLETGSDGANPGGDGLERRVKTVVDEGGTSWRELLDEVAADLEATLDSMQADGRVRYSPDDGYVLQE